MCRVIIVYDGRTVSNASQHKLQLAYGSEHVVSISSLAQRTSTKHGRRLFTKVFTVIPKLWVWSLPPEKYPLVMHMDLDVLVHENIDDVFALKFDTPLTAVPCLIRSGNALFNAGVILLRPSRSSHAALLKQARWTLFPWNGYMPRSHNIHSPSPYVELAPGERRQWCEIVCDPPGPNPQLDSEPNPHRALPHHRYDICAPNDGCGRTSCLPATRLFPNAPNPMRTCRGRLGGATGYMMPKTCSFKVGDQSLHSFVFSNRKDHWDKWVPMPALGLNIDARKVTNLTGARLIHFMGEPKPWLLRSHPYKTYREAGAAYIKTCNGLLLLPQRRATRG